MTHNISQRTLDALLRRSPSLFFTHLFPKIDTVRDFECSWHLHAISQHLLEMYHGTCLRLIVNAPPRSLKDLFGKHLFYTLAAWTGSNHQSHGCHLRR